MSTVEQSRHLATAIPGPRSSELIARKNSAVSRGVGTTMPVYAARAFGGIVEDVDGNRLIDLGSGIAVTTIGNASPRVVAAVSDQAANFTHTCFMVTPYEGYVAVAEALNRLTPGSEEKRSALFNSGSEAVENAVKIARSYTGKQAVVAFDHAYHGRTNLTMALTAKSMPYKHGFGPFAPEVYRAPLSYPFRDAEFGKELATDGELAARRAITVIDKQVGATNLACVVIEPIQGEGGVWPLSPEFADAVTAACGIGALLGAVVGTVSTCLTGPVNAIISSTGAKERHYTAGIAIGVLAIVFGLFSPAFTKFMLATPPAFIATLAGVALGQTVLRRAVEKAGLRQHPGSGTERADPHPGRSRPAQRRQQRRRDLPGHPQPGNDEQPVGPWHRAASTRAESTPRRWR